MTQPVGSTGRPGTVQPPRVAPEEVAIAPAMGAPAAAPGLAGDQTTAPPAANYNAEMPHVDPNTITVPPLPAAAPRKGETKAQARKRIERFKRDRNEIKNKAKHAKAFGVEMKIIKLGGALMSKRLRVFAKQNRLSDKRDALSAAIAHGADAGKIAKLQSEVSDASASLGVASGELDQLNKDMANLAGQLGALQET